MIYKIKKKAKDFINDAIQKEIREIYALNKENYWANVFNSSVKGSEWIKDVPFNVGRWAANYSLLYLLFRVLNEVKPSTILELGLGETSKLFQAYIKKYQVDAYCATIEHDLDWIKLKKQTVIEEGNIQIINLQLENINVNNFTTVAYKDLGLNLKNLHKKFELIVIDGPFGSDNYSRYNIIEIINEGLLADDFIIIMDDYERSGEKQTFSDLQKLLSNSKIDFETGFYSGNKEQVVLCSKKYKYVTSF